MFGPVGPAGRGCKSNRRHHVSERGREPTKLYLWILTFDFHVIFMSQNIILTLIVFQPVTSIKTILSLRALPDQRAGLAWHTAPERAYSV